jgi:hypothetical protein
MDETEDQICRADQYKATADNSLETSTPPIRLPIGLSTVAARSPDRSRQTLTNEGARVTARFTRAAGDTRGVLPLVVGERNG